MNSIILVPIYLGLLLSPTEVQARVELESRTERLPANSLFKAIEAENMDEPRRQEAEFIDRNINNLKPQLENNNKSSYQTEASLEDRVKGLEEAQRARIREAESLRVGGTTFLLAGYASTRYAYQKGKDNKPSVNFNPIFLWELNDRLIFETEVAVTNSGEVTEIDLEYANFAYNISPFFVLRLGKFLTPLSYFGEKYHPDWINKMPDRPLHHEAGMLPESSVGIELRGVIPVTVGRLIFSFYLSKDPNALVVAGEGGHDHTGITKSQVDSPVPQPQAKSIGARLGYVPIPGLEIGYAMQQARNSSSWSSPGEGLRATFQEVDLNYICALSLIRGAIDFRGEWGWSRQEDHNPIPSFEGESKRDGGYLQLAYRPSMVANAFLRSLEPVLRFDALNSPFETGQMGKHKRTSMGLNLWVNHSTVIKVAYQKSQITGLIEDQPSQTHAFLLQASIGF